MTRRRARRCSLERSASLRVAATCTTMSQTTPPRAATATPNTIATFATSSRTSPRTSTRRAAVAPTTTRPKKTGPTNKHLLPTTSRNRMMRSRPAPRRRSRRTLRQRSPRGATASSPPSRRSSRGAPPRPPRRPPRRLRDCGSMGRVGVPSFVVRRPTTIVLPTLLGWERRARAAVARGGHRGVHDALREEHGVVVRGAACRIVDQHLGEVREHGDLLRHPVERDRRLAARDDRVVLERLVERGDFLDGELAELLAARDDEVVAAHDSRRVGARVARVRLDPLPEVVLEGAVKGEQPRRRRRRRRRRLIFFFFCEVHVDIHVERDAGVARVAQPRLDTDGRAAPAEGLEREANAVPADVAEAAERVAVGSRADVALGQELVGAAEREGRGDALAPPEDGVFKESAHRQEPRVVHEHGAIEQRDARGATRLDHAPRFTRRARDGFLDEDVLAGLGELDDPLDVERRRQRHVHRVDLRVRDERVVTLDAADAPEAELGAPGLGLVPAPRRDADQVARRRAQHAARVLLGDRGAAHDPEADRAVRHGGAERRDDAVRLPLPIPDASPAC
mmetsp:Transcript_20245/g.80846  ORF Transcript_20245/g.80846 Transcript_20245/m.80846 type:complete len:566 (+) Transcript_20245:1019-2716(+)